MIANYYFRKTFNLASTNIEELLLSATCTDVYAGTMRPLRVFINGTEINSRIEAVSGQGNETLYFDLTSFAHLVRTGTNTLAVQVGNTWASDWDDVAFDVSLKAVFSNPHAPRLSVQRTQPNGTQVQVETPIGIWQIQSCDGMPAINWQVMQTFTNSVGGVQTFPDTGQNGRLPPASVSGRFYRLVPF
jgi:hypothetical protein